MSDAKAVAVEVLSVHQWAPTLFSFRVSRPSGFKFTAGQFVRLGLNPTELQHFNQDQLTLASSVLDERIFRAYSVASSPFDEFLEFFSVVIVDGAFTSRLQYLQVGDRLWLNPMPFGYLTLARYQQPAPKDLWLLATGTGLAPFLSMLQTLDVWTHYQTIVLAYSARTSQELAYQTQISELAATFQAYTEGQAAQFHYVPIVTREAGAGQFSQRLPALIDNHALEHAVGQTLSADSSHVMLCGNPQMVADTKTALQNRGLLMNRRGEGNIAVENYW